MKRSKTRRRQQLSVVVLNYNSKELLLDCLRSLRKVQGELVFETIVIDNKSSDGSVAALRRNEKLYDRLIEAQSNLGFAEGNNLARGVARGRYVLFLNPDTIVHEGTLAGCTKYLQENPGVGAITCKQILPNGRLDPDSRRKFPSLLNSITRLSGLARLLPNSALFNDYWYGGLAENILHEIDVAQGAFFMVRKDLLEKVDWFDSDYFLNGEDIDLSWKIKEAGSKIVYNPEFSIDHLKKAVKGKNKSLRVEMAGVWAMEIFYKKRLWGGHSLVVNYAVILGINMLKIFRFVVYYLPG